MILSNPVNIVNISTIAKVTKIPCLKSFNGRNITSTYVNNGIWSFNEIKFNKDDFALVRVYHSNRLHRLVMSLLQLVIFLLKHWESIGTLPRRIELRTWKTNWIVIWLIWNTVRLTQLPEYHKKDYLYLCCSPSIIWLLSISWFQRLFLL